MVTDIKGRYGCPLCDHRFDTIGDKKRHMRLEHSEEKRDG